MPTAYLTASYATCIFVSVQTNGDAPIQVYRRPIPRKQLRVELVLAIISFNSHDISDMKSSKQSKCIEAYDSAVVSFDNLAYKLRNRSCAYLDSALFPLARSDFMLRIYPHGMNEDEDYMAVNLVNVSSHDVKLRYSITLLNQTKGRAFDHQYVDPEASVVFKGMNISLHDERMRLSYEEDDLLYGHDNEWGSDAFMLFDNLMDEENGFSANDQITFRIDVEYHDDCLDFDGQPWTRFVAVAQDEGELIRIAKHDLSRTIQKLSKTVQKQTFHHDKQMMILETHMQREGYHDHANDIQSFHVYTSRLGTAASKISRTLDSSALITSLTKPRRSRRSRTPSLIAI
jgi:hypothetical protein